MIFAHSRSFVIPSRNTKEEIICDFLMININLYKLTMTGNKKVTEMAGMDFPNFVMQIAYAGATSKNSEIHIIYKDRR